MIWGSHLNEHSHLGADPAAQSSAQSAPAPPAVTSQGAPAPGTIPALPPTILGLTHKQIAILLVAAAITYIVIKSRKS